MCIQRKESKKAEKPRKNKKSRKECKKMSIVKLFDNSDYCS